MCEMTSEPHEAPRRSASPVDERAASASSATQAGPADVLAIGFGTTAAMWGVGYVCRLPGVAAPSWLLFLIFLALLISGGFVAGRFTARGVRGGVYAGLLSGVLNLLILGSLIGGEHANQVRMAALWWVPGALVVSAALGALGATIGRYMRPTQGTSPNWPAALAFVAACATLLLLAVGGAVTGHDYGLAVVDWPNTEGYNMFLYPLARMTGGIYYEHSHRLIGSLVGLTTLTLALYLHLREPRRWIKVLGWVALAMVIGQGILGGLRVTGRFTFSTLPQDTAPNIALAIIHGVFGQLFFVVLTAIGVFLTATWTAARQRVEAVAASTDRTLSVVLVAMVVAQLILGALVRHLTWALQIQRYGLAAEPAQLMARGTWALHAHITVAVVVTLLTVAMGVRAWGLYPHVPVLRRLGLGLLTLIGLQLALGVAALLAAGSDSVAQPAATFGVILTTAHQTVGAAILALAASLMLCVFRLLVPQPANA